MKKIQPVLTFILSVITTFLLASIVGTQIMLADILSFGLDVSWSDRISATIHDIVGLAPILSSMITAAFLVGFTVAALCTRFLGGDRKYWYRAAGFTAPPATLMLIKALMGGTLLASARTGFGLLIFALCGLAGGWLFAWLTQKREV